MEVTGAEFRAAKSGPNKGLLLVNKDFYYGYFVPEHALFALLTKSQQEAYLEAGTVRLDVPPEAAQKIIDMGQTPFTKRRVV